MSTGTNLHPFHQGNGVIVGHSPDDPPQTVFLTPTALEVNVLVTGPCSRDNALILAKTLEYRVSHGLATIAVDPTGELRRQLDGARDIAVVDTADLLYCPAHNPLAEGATETVTQLAAILNHTAPYRRTATNPLLEVLLSDLRHHNSRHPERVLGVSDLAAIEPPQPVAATISPVCHGVAIATANPEYWQTIAELPADILSDLFAPVRAMGHRAALPYAPTPLSLAAETIHNESGLLITTAGKPPPDAYEILLAVLCREVVAAAQAEVQRNPVNLALIVDRCDLIQSMNWNAVADPDADSAIQMMLSDVRTAYPMPTSNPLVADWGTVLMMSPLPEHLEQLATERWSGASTRIPQSQSDIPTAFLYSDAYGEPTGVFFRPANAEP